MKLLKYVLATLLLMAAPAFAQSNMRYSTGVTGGTQTKITIAVTDTYQLVYAANVSRKGCLIQNNGSNPMYVFFGTAAPGDKTTSWVISAGGNINCSMGGVFINQRAIYITGTSTEVAVIDQLL